MPRNIVLFCDGTANKFGEKNTNVVRIVQSLVRDDQEQIVYYDPGVGTMPGPGLVTRTGRFLSKVIDLAFATGLDRNVEEAYSFLMEQWQEDDRIYLFGFSRGAYTARVVAALLHHIGLLPRGSQNLIPYALRLLRIARKDAREVGDQFRETFARPTGSPGRRCKVHFVGVWDTVSSVGWFWEPAKFRYTATNPGISIARHAISIDERRAFYRQNRFYAAAGQDLKQLWFPGVHSDVGGGYADSHLGRSSFEWMLDEAIAAGLHVDAARRDAAASRPPVAKPWLEKKHNELLKPWWWPLELFPKIHFNTQKQRKEIRMNFFRSRRLLDGELLHESTVRRIKDDPRYNPASISRAFLEHVRDPRVAAATMPYTKDTRAIAAAPLPSM
ncbi:MAG TPA: DUF2235 domain-containing protein [Thermoanaerobaculia bacterium]|nr:DUF2235 domain-containing protein [Thermoanaerobaculia bacterium]